MWGRSFMYPAVVIMLIFCLSFPHVGICLAPKLECASLNHFLSCFEAFFIGRRRPSESPREDEDLGGRRQSNRLYGNVVVLWCACVFWAKLRGCTKTRKLCWWLTRSCLSYFTIVLLKCSTFQMVCWWYAMTVRHLTSNSAHMIAKSYLTNFRLLSVAIKPGIANGIIWWSKKMFAIYFGLFSAVNTAISNL